MQGLKLPKSKLSFILIGLILALTFVLYNCGSGNWPLPSVPTESVTVQDWYNPLWAYRKKITIDSTFVDNDLSYFPVLVSTTDADLQVRAQLSGNDILFTDSAHTTKLNHEIEKYTNSTGELFAWVQVPSVVSSTPNTVIYMYYGYSGAADQQNVTSTWDDNGAGNFKMVQHLWETTAGGGSYDDHLDSTLNNNDGEIANVTMDATGQIDGADEFDGSTATITVDTSDSLNITDAITLEAWVYNDSGQSSTRRIVMKTIPPQEKGYQMDIRTSDPGVLNLYLSYSGGWRSINSGATYIDTDQWVHVAGTWSDVTDTASIYKNGTLVTSTSVADGAMVTSASTLTIGSTNASNHYFDGGIDEVRISNTARSAAWIKASFENQTATSTFINLDSECASTALPC